MLSKEAISDTTNLTLTSGWKCNSNDDCTATNSMCLNNLCQCASEYIFNADMTSCLKGNICFIETAAFTYRNIKRETYIL